MLSYAKLKVRYMCSISFKQISCSQFKNLLNSETEKSKNPFVLLDVRPKVKLKIYFLAVAI